MKNKLIIGGVVLLLLIILCIRSCKKEYITQNFPESIIVKNYTNNQKADTVVMIILNKIMGYDTMTVNIYKLNNMFDTENLVIVAHTVENKFEKHNFMIYLKEDLSYDLMKSTLSHELIHIQQIENNKLSFFDNGYVWSKDSFNYKNVVYENRPYEIEAFNNMTNVKSKLNKLYEKNVFVNPF